MIDDDRPHTTTSPELLSTLGVIAFPLTVVILGVLIYLIT